MSPVVCGAVLLAVAVADCGDGAGTSPRAESPTVVPAVADRHEKVAVVVTSRRGTGVSGDTRRVYIVEAIAVRPAAACVNRRDRQFPTGPAGRRVRADLDLARGEGGELGWCPGRYRGSVTYFEGFACPATGACRPPGGFRTRARVVARFSFRVR